LKVTQLQTQLQTKETEFNTKKAEFDKTIKDTHVDYALLRILPSAPRITSFFPPWPSSMKSGVPFARTSAFAVDKGRQQAGGGTGGFGSGSGGTGGTLDLSGIKSLYAS